MTNSEEQLLTELIGLACAGIGLVGVAWIAVATVLGPALATVVPAPVRPIRIGDGPGAGGVVTSGWPRVALVLVVTVALALVGLVAYARVIRPRLRDRGLAAGSGEWRDRP